MVGGILVHSKEQGWYVMVIINSWASLIDYALKLLKKNLSLFKSWFLLLAGCPAGPVAKVFEIVRKFWSNGQARLS